jgi:hypothetical protein
VIPVCGCLVAIQNCPRWLNVNKKKERWGKAVFLPAYHQAGCLMITNSKDFNNVAGGRWFLTLSSKERSIQGFRIGPGFALFEEAKQAANIIHSSGWDIESSCRKKDQGFIGFVYAGYSAVEQIGAFWAKEGE